MVIIVSKSYHLYNWLKTTDIRKYQYDFFSICFGGEKVLGFGVEEETTQPHSLG